MLVLQKAARECVRAYCSLVMGKKNNNHSQQKIFSSSDTVFKCIISSTQLIWIIRLSTFVLLFMPWFCTDNHFATNTPWSQTDISMLQTCNPLQIAERGCKMILWGRRSLYLVSTLPYSLPPAPPSISGKLLYMGGYGTERLGYSLNYLCKVSSLYAFETQFEGLVLLFPQGLWFTRVTTRDHYLITTPAPSSGTAG